MSEPVLVEFDRLRAALAEAESVDVVQDQLDKAEALRVLASRRVGWSDVAVRAAAHRLRCERRMGELLPARGRGGRGHAVELPEGVSRENARQLRQVADVAETDFEAYIRERLAVGEEPTRAGLLAYARRLAKARRGAEDLARDVETSEPPAAEEPSPEPADAIDPSLLLELAGLERRARADERPPAQSVARLLQLALRVGGSAL